MQKVPEYSESERLAWQIRSLKLSALLKETRLSLEVDIIFKIPVVETNENILIDVFKEHIKLHGIGKSGKINNSEIEMIVNPLDIKLINQKLEQTDIKNFSPEIIELCIGKYESGGNYATTFDYDELYKLGLDNDLDVLNIYVDKLKIANVMKWTSISEHSINMKAKDVKRLLVKAVNQIPLDGPGIIHIGYENLDGPYVERKRLSKAAETIQKFDYKDKDIQAVFCNSIQLLATSNNFDWAETACFYKKSKHPDLKHDLLLADTVSGFNRPHWEDDIANLEK